MKTKKFILLIGDILILYLSLIIALSIRYQGFSLEIFQKHVVPFSIIYLIWLIVFYIHNLYDLDIAKNNIEFSAALIRALIIGGLISIIFFYLAPNFAFGAITPKTNLFLNILVFVVLFYGWRYLFNFLVGSVKLKENIAIIGYNPEAIKTAKEMIKNPQLGYRLKLIIKNHESINEKDLPGVKFGQGLNNLRELLEQEKITTAIVTPDIYRSPDLIQTLFECIRYKIDFINLPTFYEKLNQKIPISTINRIWFLENISQRPKKAYEIFKRLFDFFLALPLLVLTFPFGILISLIIKFDSPGPIFYIQERIGRGGKSFKLIKFRSMIENAEKNGPLRTEKDDKRTTRVGRFLRKTRLDELPQFINILKGEMSFVGPRAERLEFHQDLQTHVPFFQERYLVKPGLTGWAQIKYGYTSSLEDDFERVRYDLYYIKNRSFVLDLGIILKTINIILRGGGR